MNWRALADEMPELFAADGGMLYVGKSVNIGYRLDRHAKSGKEFDFFGCIEVPGEILGTVESAYIEALDPCHNNQRGRGWRSWHDDMVSAIRARWATVERRLPEVA